MCFIIFKVYYFLSIQHASIRVSVKCKIGVFQIFLYRLFSRVAMQKLSSKSLSAKKNPANRPYHICPKSNFSLKKGKYSFAIFLLLKISLFLFHILNRQLAKLKWRTLVETAHVRAANKKEQVVSLYFNSFQRERDKMRRKDFCHNPDRTQMTIVEWQKEGNWRFWTVTQIKKVP